MLPTPKAGDADFALPRTSGRSPEKSTHLATRLKYAHNNLLPTPTINGNNNRKGLSPKSGDGLATWAKQILPTPRASDGNGMGIHGSGGMDLRTALTSGTNGQLNPRFVEWMMGYPAGWTELEDSETP